MTKLKSDTQCKCKGVGFISEIVNGYETYTECECHVKERIESYLKNSGVDPKEYELKSLEQFTTDTEEAKQMKELAYKFIEDAGARGIGYFGKSGTGKTHICIGICQELTKRRALPHFYFSYIAEMQKLKASFFDDEAYSEIMSKVSNRPILYIDDLMKFSADKNGKISSQELKILYDLINARYLNRKITIFSSEYSVEDINKIDTALASRIYEMAQYSMKVSGKNRRFV